MNKVSLAAHRASLLGPDLNFREFDLSPELPLAVQSPDRPYSHLLTIPITSDPAVVAVAARLVVRLAEVKGRIRVGIMKPDGSDFADSKVVADLDRAEVELGLYGAGETMGALVFQCLPSAEPASFRLVSLDLQENEAYPAGEVDENLLRYLRGGFNDIEGWCGYLNVLFLRRMDEVLFAHGVGGGVGEIGVHHGKFFVALLNLVRPGAKSLALDVFGNQEFNLDASGSGDRTIFENNINRWGPSPEGVAVVQADSSAIGPYERRALRDRVGTLKFFSVDGCHAVEHTLADIATAMDLLAPGGILVLDDFLNQDFPEVHQAVAYLYLSGRPSLVPFAIGQNKLYMTHIGYQAAYVEAARRVMQSFTETASITDVKYYGYPVLSWRTAEKGWEFPT